MQQLQEGILFDNRYLLIKLLGRGGFSEVWLVEDTKVANKKMALKIYAPGMGLDDDGVKLFSSEFELVFDLNHSHLLRPAHFDICERSPYLLMPYCERGSASKLIEKITEEETWHFLHDVAAGLAYLHEQEPPIIHQDIKPDNVLIDNKKRFLITDFGISTKARSTLRRSMGDAKSGGTVAYMPPERFEGKKIPIKASDIWALGATLFELLEGDVPFIDILGGRDQLNGAKIPEMTGNYSPEIKKIITLCLQKETWDRPTAQQLVEWTEQHFKGEKLTLTNTPKTTRETQRKINDVQNPPVTKQKKPPKPSRKTTLWIVIIALLIGIGSAIAVILSKPKMAELAIKSTPEGALVFINDTLKGTTPCPMIYVQPDTPTLITIKKEDYEIYEKIERYKAGLNVISIELEESKIKMIYVQGGTFTMGCTSEQGNDCYSDEKPAHQVTVSDFYIGKYPVTQAQWKEVMGSYPSELYNTGCDDCPVEMVSWNDVQEFIRTLNAQTGKNYRLPTEAEWEYAARGGNQSKGYKYSGSNTIDDVAWYYDNYALIPYGEVGTTHPVGTNLPNELGIYDMSGNVWEWCSDWYGSYSSDAQTNPTGAMSGSYRVLRGGSWSDGVNFAHVSFRAGGVPYLRSTSGGFRLACSSE